LASETELGQWIGLEVPTPIKLYDVRIVSQIYSTAANTVDEFYIYAKKQSGDTWTDLGKFTGIAARQGTPAGVTVNVNSTDYYTFFVLVATKRDSAAAFGVSIRVLDFYGTPEYDPEAHGTDVIARSIPNVPNMDWLEVYWDANDTTSYSGSGTTVTDLSGNGVTGALANGVGFDSEYNAFSFDGVNDTIQGTFSGHSLQSGYTMSTWINPINMSDDDYIATFGVGNVGTAFGINFENSGGLRAFIWGSSTPGIVAETLDNTINNGEWIHVTATFISSSGDINLYINSSVVATGSGQAITSISSSAPLLLGARNDNGTINRHANVKIANFRLFNRALTADEVWQLYAYQKDYFQVSPDALTFKGGRLGVGTEEPRATLDVRGDIRGGCPVFFSVHREEYPPNATPSTIIYSKVQINKGGGYDASTGIFTAPIPGYYQFNFHDLSRNTGGTVFVQARVNNDKLPGSTNTSYTGVYHENTSTYENISGSWIVYLNTGDNFRLWLEAGNLNNNLNNFCGHYLSI